MTDEEYQRIFQIGVTPEMLGVKEMSVQELVLGGLRFELKSEAALRVKVTCSYSMNTISNELNRNQAHLLYLYLKKRFDRT